MLSRSVRSVGPEVDFGEEADGVSDRPLDSDRHDLCPLCCPAMHPYNWQGGVAMSARRDTGHGTHTHTHTHTHTNTNTAW